MAWRISALAFLIVALPALMGCTVVLSEKPLFTADEYDTGGSLVGHYVEVDGGGHILVMRGMEGRLALLEFKSNKSVQKNKHPAAAKTGGRRGLTQVLYAAAAAVPLGGGDFVLQIECATLIDNGSMVSSPWANKKSAYRNYTLYGFVAQDRNRDYLWATANVYREGDDARLLFNRYALSTGATDDDNVRIIPSNTPHSAILALFRDLIDQSMRAGGGAELYRRTDRIPQPNAEERAAIILNDTGRCRRG